jgi:hypothetical protein
MYVITLLGLFFVSITFFYNTIRQILCQYIQIYFDIYYNNNNINYFYKASIFIIAIYIFSDLIN